MNLTYAYILLALGIFFELISTSFLKDTNGFTRLYPSLICIIALCICIYLLSHSMQFIPVGIVYATWAGLGIVGITVIAIIKYKQIPNISTIIGLSLIVVGVAIVHLMNDIDVK
jgi:small multidrug resistance pump